MSSISFSRGRNATFCRLLLFSLFTIFHGFPLKLCVLPTQVWEALETVLCALDKLLLAAEGSATAAAPAGLRSKFVAFAAKLVLPAAAKVS